MSTTRAVSPAPESREETVQIDKRKGVSAAAVGLFRDHRTYIVEFALFLSSVVALQGTRFVFTLIVAGGLRPADFTIWTQFVTFMSYAPAVLLGVANGMNRMVPILVGRGDRAGAEQTESATWSIVGVVVVASLALVALSAAAGMSSWFAAAVLSGCAMTVYQVQQFAMRSRLVFNRASLQQWGWAFLVAIGAVVLLLSNRSLGPVLWIWTVGSLIAVAIGYALRRPIILRPSPARTWALLAMGFPIMLSGLLGTLFLTADRWVAAARLDPTAAGTYGLASMISSAIFLVPGVIAQQQYPRLAMLKGANAPASKLRAAALRQSLLAAAASGASAIVAAPVVLIVIPWMLPAYAAAAGPAVLLSLGSVAIAGGTGPGNLMLVVGALWPYLAIQISCFAIAVALMWLGSGLAGTLGLAVGFVAGQTLLMLVLIVVARRYVRGKAEVR